MNSLLPPNATSFERSVEQVTKADLSSPIRFLWNYEKCPTELLYVLAITLDVDEWDERWSDEFKRKTLQEAYLVHSRKGTPDAVRRILRNAGYEEIVIQEGLNGGLRDGSIVRNGLTRYGEEMAYAKYVIWLSKTITADQAKQVRRLLDDAAPLHCELVGLNFTEALILRNGTIHRDGTYNRGTA